MQITANCDFEPLTPDQLLRDRLVTGTQNSKVRENLLKEKKLTLEKALDIARAAESTAAQMKVMTTESRLNAVKEKKKEQSDGSPLSMIAGSKTVNSVVGIMKDATVLHLARLVHIVSGRITL